MMKYFYLIFIFVLPGLNALSQTTTGGNKKKVALVIGVSSYKNATPLKHPVNDATDMGWVLKGLGFNVTYCLDPDSKKMRDTIDNWCKKLIGVDVCFVFYSGHGAEANGENYIFATDANQTEPDNLKYDAYPVNKIFNKIDFAKVKTNIIILDACRDNPFTNVADKGLGHNGGLANMSNPNGYFIGLATAPGSTASDAGGRNGVFTASILKNISEPLATLDHVFNLVKKDVREKTHNKQTPFVNSSLDGDFYFVIAAQPVAAQPLVLSPIIFDFDSSVLKTASYVTLDAVAAYLRETNKSVIVKGYMSSEGTVAHNMALSKKQASAVKSYLVNAGVDAKRIRVKGYGETNPIADNATEEGRAKNRRVEFEVVD